MSTRHLCAALRPSNTRTVWKGKPGQSAALTCRATRVSQRIGSGATAFEREVRAVEGLNTRTPTTQMKIRAATSLFTRLSPSRVGQLLDIRPARSLLTQPEKPV